jgi:hypothetical protein
MPRQKPGRERKKGYGRKSAEIPANEPFTRRRGPRRAVLLPFLRGAGQKPHAWKAARQNVIASLWPIALAMACGAVEGRGRVKAVRAGRIFATFQK